MNNIDYTAVIEIINNFLNNEKVEIFGISYGEENQLRKAIENLLKERQADKDRINRVLTIAFEDGQIDGEHHKAWVIDQIVRILTGENYDEWVQHYEYDETTGEEYEWDTGIAP